MERKRQAQQKNRRENAEEDGQKDGKKWAKVIVNKQKNIVFNASTIYRLRFK